MASYSNIVGNTSTPASLALQNKITPQAPVQALVGSLAPKPYIPQPTAPIKKQVITTPNGGTIEHHFDNSATVGTSAPKQSASTQQLASTNFSTDGVGNGGDPSTNYVRTPSGAVVDATTGELQVPPGAGISQPETVPAVSPYFGQASKGLINIGQNGSQGYTDAINAQSKLKQDIAEKIGGIEGERIPLNFIQGKEGALRNQYASQLDAAQQAVNQQQTQQGQQISAFGGAGNLNQPQNNFPFVFNPSTGTYTAPGVGGGTGGTGGLTYNPQQDAQNLAKEVIAGTKTYDDAKSAMGYAGSTAEGTLQSAITSQGGNLAQIKSRTASQLASIGDLQTKLTDIKTNAPAANDALTVLSNYAQQLGGGDTPILQGLKQLLGNTAQGSQAVSAFQSQLSAVRALWSAVGGAPDKIPDNITSAQILAIQQQLKTQVGIQTAAYQNQLDKLLKGNSSTTSSTSGNGGSYTSNSGNTYNLPY